MSSLDEKSLVGTIPEEDGRDLSSAKPLKSSASDEQAIAQFGKRQRFNRNFNVVSVVGLSTTIMMSWEANIVNVQVSLLNGGPTGTIVAYPLVFLGVLAQTLVMAEMASMIPLSGGQYNWVAILGPPKLANFLSYTVGWTIVLAWQAAIAGSAWVSSNIIVTLSSVAHPNYAVKNWHVTLVFAAIIALDIFVNTFLGRVFPTLECLAFVLHVVLFFVIIIVFVYLAPKQSNDAVFKTFVNGGEFSTMTESVFVGSVNLMFGFIGTDAGAHVAEEVKDAARAIPKGMITNLLVYFIMGYAMLITFLYCVPIDDFLSPTLSFPFITAFQNITHSTEAAVAMTALILVMLLSSNMALLATASRMLWAFAREDGVPFSKYISRIHTKANLPVWAIGVTATANVLLALIGLGSAVAFNALIGLCVGGFYTAFIVSASLMLWRRLVTANMPWGPFKLGWAGVPITIVALCYSMIGIIFSFWPPVAKPSVETMNWSVVVFVGVLALAMVRYAVWARHTYTGPKLEVDTLHWLELFEKPRV